MAASLEVELKLRAEDESPLLRLATAERLGAFDLGPATDVLETDRYLDTGDGRLAAARWACRLRTRLDRVRVSLKGPAQHRPGASIHRRPEVEGPATEALDPAAWPASEARDELLRLSAGEPMVERLTLEQRRIERQVGDPPVGILSLDWVRVLRRGAEHGRFVAVELELAEPDPEARLTDALLAELRAVDGLAPEVRSKLERALDLVPVGP
jgi:inorganic triphosphatase YgiF